jgi:AcrR family transcriptional regulator
VTATRFPARERLLETADALFYAEGIHSVGIDRLLAESGVAKATLYQHFRSKDALVVAYLERRLSRGQDRLDTALAAWDAHRPAAPPAERVVAVFELLAQWMTDPGFRGCPFINAAAEHPEPGSPVLRTVLEHRARTRARFRELAEPLPGEDPAALAAVLLALYDGALVSADLGDPREAAATAVPAVRRLLAGHLP